MSNSTIQMVQLTPQEEAAEGFTEIRRILSDRERATMEALAEADALQIAADSLTGQLQEMQVVLSPLYALAHSRPDLFPTKVGESLLPAIVKRCLDTFQAPGAEVLAKPIAGIPAKAAREAMQARILELEGVAADYAARVKELQGVIADQDATIFKYTKYRTELSEMVAALRIDLAQEKRAMASIHDAGGIELFRQAIADAARAPLLERIARCEAALGTAREALQRSIASNEALESENTSMRDAAASAKRALEVVCPF